MVALVVIVARGIIDLQRTSELWLQASVLDCLQVCEGKVAMHFVVSLSRRLQR